MLDIKCSSPALQSQAKRRSLTMAEASSTQSWTNSLLDNPMILDNLRSNLANRGASQVVGAVVTVASTPGRTGLESNESSNAASSARRPLLPTPTSQGGDWTHVAKATQEDLARVDNEIDFLETGSSEVERKLSRSISLNKAMRKALGELAASNQELVKVADSRELLLREFNSSSSSQVLEGLRPSMNAIAKMAQQIAGLNAKCKN